MEIVRNYPRDALRARQGGRAVLTCRIGLDTRLEGCRVVQETPPGRGFGQAALASSVHFRFRPPTENGQPVPGREVTVGVDFTP
jgi:protein TonB